MRRVYIDAGANWGDTLDSYQHFASPLHRHANNWEIICNLHTFRVALDLEGLREINKRKNT